MMRSETRDTPLAAQLFAALADGRVHSGEELAASLGVTRSAVWKVIEQLRAAGLDIEAQTHQGYRWVRPLEVLDTSRITAAAACSLRSVEVVWETASTNAALLARPPPPVGQFDVLLAENQSGGRGRRGRSWQAALGGSLALSLATSFEPLPRDLPALTLVVGLAVQRALQTCGARNLKLKWPNDLVTAEFEKLGGILVELRAEADGPGHVVVGIGLNLRLDASTREKIAIEGTSAADLESLGLDSAARNRLVARILEECVATLLLFAQEGFKPFATAWAKLDALRDQPVRLLESSGEVQGIARGIDAQGALRVELPDGSMKSVWSADVSVRTRSV